MPGKFTSHSQRARVPAWWGFCHHGTSRRQTPTSVHARCRAGNGEERGRTQHARNPPRSCSRAPSKPHGVRPASVRGPWSCHHLENPTAKALWAQPSAQRPPAAPGGSVIMEPRGARRPPARTHAVGLGMGKSGGEPSMLETPPRSRSRAPSKPRGVRPASVRGPWSRHRLENPTEKALWAQPWARRPPAAHGGSVITSRRQTPTSAHARCRAGNGEELGRTQHARNPATLPL